MTFGFEARRSVVLIATALFLSAGCSEQANDSESAVPAGTTATATSTPSPAPVAVASRDACAVISAEELKTATGIDAEGKSSKSGGADVCTWMGADGKSAIVQLYSHQSDYEDSREAFEGLYDTKSEPLAGVGDNAFYISGTTGPFNTATISAMKGSQAVSVQIMGMGDMAELKENATALSRLLLEKL